MSTGHHDLIDEHAEIRHILTANSRDQDADRQDEQDPQQASTGPGASLSKNQLKRHLKRQRMLDERPAKRAAERARKKAKKLEAKLTDQPAAASPKTRGRPAKPASIFPAIVALDCRFDDKMSEKVACVLSLSLKTIHDRKQEHKCPTPHVQEIVSLDRQIAHSYSIHRKAKVQFEKLLRERLKQNGNHHLKWKSVRFTPQSIAQIVEKNAPADPDAKPTEGGDPPLAPDDQPKQGTSPEEKADDLPPRNEEATAAPTVASSATQALETASVERQDLPRHPPQSAHPTTKDMDDSQKDGPLDRQDQQLVRDALLGREHVVYLTADSGNVLRAIEPDTVYVIGAIVDHNRYKNLCLDLATQQGFRHAQLPINEYFAKLKTRKVLTVNQVFEILVNYLEEQDWEKAFERVIPSRKL